MMMYCCGDRADDITVDIVTSSAAESNAVSSFDIDDTPVTFRTRPARAKLVSTMLRQRSISQTVATSRIPTRTTPAVPRHIVTDTPESSTKDKMAPSAVAQSSPSTTQTSADVSMSEEITKCPSSPSLGKITSGQRSRSSITRTDAMPLSLPCSEVAVKADSNKLQPVKVEITATEPLATATSPVISSVEGVLSQASPTKPVLTTAALDSSTEFSECKNFEAVTSHISPITRNNQTLLQHLKRPPCFAVVQSDTVDLKKLRVSPMTDIKYSTMDRTVRSSPQAGESKSSHSVDSLSSLSPSSVTYNLPPTRQPLSVRIDASNTSSSSSSAAAPAKSSVVSPRFVSHLNIVLIMTTHTVAM